VEGGVGWRDQVRKLGNDIGIKQKSLAARMDCEIQGKMAQNGDGGLRGERISIGVMWDLRVRAGFSLLEFRVGEQIKRKRAHLRLKEPVLRPEIFDWFMPSSLPVQGDLHCTPAA
jgi:hypothetical protein